MHPDDLENWVTRELGQLPQPRAPRTLLPRVMSAIRELADRPWYSRPWLTWPLAWQVASLAALLIAGVAAYTVSPAATVPYDRLPGFVARTTADTAALASYLQAALTTTQTIWRTLLQPVSPYAFALVATMSLMCAALGAALNQIVLGRGFHQ